VKEHFEKEAQLRVIAFCIYHNEYITKVKPEYFVTAKYKTIAEYVKQAYESGKCVDLFLIQKKFENTIYSLSLQECEELTELANDSELLFDRYLEEVKSDYEKMVLTMFVKRLQTDIEEDKYLNSIFKKLGEAFNLKKYIWR